MNLEMNGIVMLINIAAVNENLKYKRTFMQASEFTSAIQSLTMTCGLIGGLYLAVFQVAKDGKSIGQLTTFLVYWAQLQGMIPL